MRPDYPSLHRVKAPRTRAPDDPTPRPRTQRACYQAAEGASYRATVRYLSAYEKALVDCRSEASCIRAARDRQEQAIREMRKQRIDAELQCKLLSYPQ
jgi:hypothetical protein